MTKYYLETIADHAIAAGVWTTCFIVMFGLIFYYLNKWYLWNWFKKLMIMVMALDKKINRVVYLLEKKDEHWVSPHDPGDEHVPN